MLVQSVLPLGGTCAFASDAPGWISLAGLASAAWLLLFSALTACVLPHQTAPYVSLMGVWWRRCGAGLAGLTVQCDVRIAGQPAC